MTSRTQPVTSDRAFLLRTVPHGEGGAIATVLTETAGTISFVARRTGTRGVLLEPFHTLALEYVLGRGELARLRAATIATARTSLWTHRATMDVAGTLCRWVRSYAAPHEPARDLFVDLETALDLLERTAGQGAPTATLASAQIVLTAFGLVLLERAGVGLHPEQCARCGRPRPARRPAWVEERDGVVCERCLAASEARAAREHGAVRLVSGGVLDRIAQPWSLLESTEPSLDGLDDWVRNAVAKHAPVHQAPPARSKQ